MNIQWHEAFFTLRFILRVWKQALGKVRKVKKAAVFKVSSRLAESRQHYNLITEEHSRT